MRFFIHLHRTTEFLFLLFGTIYMLAFLVWKNNPSKSFEAEVVLKLGALPLAFLAILYAVLSFRLLLKGHMNEEEKHAPFKTADLLWMIIALLLFFTLAGGDLFFPNVTIFPKP